MKRRLFKLVVFLLLGVITTIAVAWGCWLSLDVYSWDVVGSKTSLTARRAPCWFVRHYQRAGMYQVEAWPVVDLLDFFGQLGDALEHDNDGYTLGEFAFTVKIDGHLSGRVTEDPQLDHVTIVQAYGWPRPSLWRSAVLRPIGQITQFQPPWQNSENDNKRAIDLLALHSGGGGFDPPYLESALSNEGSVRIIWSGFALDLLLYSVAWFLTYFGVRAFLFIAGDWSPFRRLASAGLCILLGVVTTVGVAWGCTTWVEFDPWSSLLGGTRGGSREGSNHVFWTIGVNDSFGRRRLKSHWFDPDARISFSGSFPQGPAKPLVPDWAPSLQPSESPSSRHGHYRIVDAGGWPLLAVFAILSNDNPLGDGWSPPEVANAIVFDEALLQTQQGLDKLRLLPLGPIWFGFVVDTVLYSVGWASLIVLALLVLRGRSLYRRRHGLCINCGYDLRGTEHEVCPECGSGHS